MRNEAVYPFAGKWRQVVASRKVWAGLLGTLITVGLWALGEIDGAQAVAALVWVLGIFIGAVAVEDGLRNVLSGIVELVPVDSDTVGEDTVGEDTVGEDTVGEDEAYESSRLPR